MLDTVLAAAYLLGSCWRAGVHLTRHGFYSLLTSLNLTALLVRDEVRQLHCDNWSLASSYFSQFAGLDRKVVRRDSLVHRLLWFALICRLCLKNSVRASIISTQLLLSKDALYCFEGPKVSLHHRHESFWC